MSRVCEPVRVGATGGGGCRCGLRIHNPSPTRTRDMGSQVLPVSVIESHAVVYNHIKRIYRKFKAHDGTFGGDRHNQRAGIHGAPAEFSFLFVY